MRAAAALLAVLALSACARLGVDSGDPLAGEEEPQAMAEAGTPPVSDGTMPLPPPRAGAGEPAPDREPDGEEVAAAPEGPADAAAAADAPHVYMALQPDSGGRTSVVFAIDRSRDNTPSDEPAIRITPEETDADRGLCNPQQLRYYNFPPESAERPVYGPDEASRGVAAKDLPGFMATAVSSEMMERGIAAELEQTRPQNICTRKLFEQTIIAATTGQG